MSYRLSRLLRPLVPIIAVAIWFGVSAPSASAVSATPTPTVFFSDGFESSGDLTGWSRSGGNAWHEEGGDTHSGSRKAEVSAWRGNDTGSNPDNLYRTISTEGYRNIQLSFWYKISEELGPNDHVYVQWGNGGSWQGSYLAHYTNRAEMNGWAEAVISLPEGADNNPNFRLRFRADFEDGSYRHFEDRDEFRLDDISLSGEEITVEVPTARVTINKQANGTLGEEDAFGFQLADGDFLLGEASLTAPDLTPEVIIANFDHAEQTRTVVLSESTMPANWQFDSVSCSRGSDERARATESESVDFVYGERSVSFEISPNDAVTCTFANSKMGGGTTQTSTLEIEKIVVGSTQSFAGHWFSFNGERDMFDADGLNVYTRPAGTYTVAEDATEGFTTAYSGDCDEQGVLTLSGGATARCVITNTAEGYVPGELIVEAIGGENDEEEVLGATVGDPANLEKYGLKSGDLIRAVDADDPDVYIVNEFGYKRLFLNPTLFGYDKVMGGWAKIKPVTAEARDAFPTSVLLRNCETADTKVYALETTGEDTGLIHWVDMTSEVAIVEDPNFFAKVFCVNNDEFSWFTQSDTAYTALAQVPVYSRW